MDTIYAPATAQGKSGVAVIRISGPDAWVVSARLCSLPKPREVRLRTLRGLDGSVLDECLVLVFEENASFTGEPVVEFQTHGSMAVTRSIMDALSSLGVRMAEPGEFTRRAFENGKLDLTQVEALADLIDAETEMQRKQAQRNFGGALAKKAEAWRETLVTVLALVEVSIDFADEDIGDDLISEIKPMLQRVHTDLLRQIQGFHASVRVRNGFEVAIVGAPNLGKSTLLNYLAGRDAAITSDVPGTTRDIVEVRMDLRGLPVTFLDTAGIRETSDVVEKIGVARTRDRAESADLRIILRGKGDDPAMTPGEDDLVLLAKADNGPPEAGVSGLSGSGVHEMLNHISSRLQNKIMFDGLSTNKRQNEHLVVASDAVGGALDILERDGNALELLSHEVRFALQALELLVGRLDVEEVFDVIFGRFCLGK